MRRFMGTFLFLAATLLFSFSLGWADSGQATGFYHTSGNQLLDGAGRPVFLRGMAFGNNVWFDTALPDFEQTEAHYRELSRMGFNSARFYMRADWFAEEKQANTFRWLDGKVALAKKYGIGLILNMHIPPGGFQSLGRGYALWENRGRQLELIAVWKRIARHYAGEPGIIGYGIVNEPWPTRNLDQWTKLVGEVVSAIREVDSNHVVIVEKAIAVGMDTLNDSISGSLNFPAIRDPNVMYEFHFYLPIVFTHQNASWLPTANVFSRYPDEGIMELCGNLPVETRVSAPNPPLAAGTAEDWTYFEGQPATVTDPAMKIGVPVVCGEHLGFGSAWFDDIVVEEIDPSGATSHVWNFDLNNAGFWLDNKLNAIRPILNRRRGGRGDSGAVRLKGNGEVSLAGATYIFNVRQGYAYRIKGWVKASGVPRSGRVALRIDFYASDGAAKPRDASFIQAEMDRFATFRERVNAPVYLGEFGCIAYAYENDRGGLQWVSDVIDACQARGIHYNFHDYFDGMFGLYNKYPTGSYTLNKALYDLLTTKQTRKTGEGA